MSEHLDAGQLLDLDLGGQFGPLFNVAQNHLAECSFCRHAHLECEALRALALEASISSETSLKRRALAGARKIELQERVLAEQSQSVRPAPARPAPVEEEAPSQSFRGILLVVAALGFGGILLFAYFRQTGLPTSPKSETPSENAPSPEPTVNLASTPELPNAEATKEALLDQKAKQILLADTERRAEESASERPRPTRMPTAVPTSLPTPQPTDTEIVRAPAPAAPADSIDFSEKPTGAEAVDSDAELPPASFEVVHGSFSPYHGDAATFQVSLPDAGSVEIRVFDVNGHSVKLVTDGVLPSGASTIPFPGRDENGAALTPGSYYVRIMTRWFSRVEAMQVLP